MTVLDDIIKIQEKIQIQIEFWIKGEDKKRETAKLGLKINSFDVLQSLFSKNKIMESEDADIFLKKTERNYFVDEITLETQFGYEYILNKDYLPNKINDFKKNNLKRLKYFLVDSY